ncbi:hypothetical protein [Rhizobium nepotum]|jgi:hypothetical protein
MPPSFQAMITVGKRDYPERDPEVTRRAALSGASTARVAARQAEVSA